MPADGAEQRAGVPELRCRFQKRSAVESPPDCLPVSARLRHQCSTCSGEVRRGAALNLPVTEAATIRRDLGRHLDEAGSRYCH